MTTAFEPSRSRGVLIASALLALAASSAIADEYRAFWVDAWGAGFWNQSQVELLLGRVGDPNSKGRIRETNCNTVIVQVRRRADVCYPSGVGEPYMPSLSPSDFNSLQAMIDAAHDTTGGKQRIEVHCWNVVFKTAKGLVYSQHSDPNNPDNYWPTRLENGSENGDGAFDPGHPKALQYLVDVCMDMVTRFDIDGIHYDYIRFEGNTEGYNPTSVARYNARYGLSGQPASSSGQFKQWRRDQVTAFVRQVYARIQTVKPNVLQSGSFVTWNPSPTASTRAAFMATRPYYDVYSDWDAWTEEGIIDISVPMTYYNWASLPSDYTKWMNFEKDRKFNRHMVVGPGIYLNSLSNAILELQMTRDASPAGNYAQGFSGYSYRVPYSGGNWDGFAPSLVANVTPSPVNIPARPWKTNPTTGHIMGTVTHLADGLWADHAQVSISGPASRSMYVDGTGFYAFIDLPPGAYTITASKAGYPNANTTATVAIGQVTGNMYVRDLQLGGTPAPSISNVQATNITNATASITWITDQPSSSRVEYGTTTSYGSLTPLDSNPVTNHAVALSGLAPNTLYHYRVISANANGSTTSNDFTFTSSGPPAISNLQVTAITGVGATITWATNAPSNSQVLYGPTTAYGSQTAVDPALVTSHTVVLTGLDPSTLYHCQARSANSYGSGQSGDATFTTLGVDAEIVIDNLDPGWTNTSPGGANWSTGSVATVPKIGTNYLYKAGVVSTNETDATHRCRWTPTIPSWGVYDVYVFYQLGTNRSPAAPYKVVYSSGDLVSVQNQYSLISEQGGWFLIGADLPFAAGSSSYVELTNSSGSTALVSADAAKFVRKHGDITPPTQPVVTDEGSYTASLDTLQASWDAIDNESGVRSFEYRIVAGGGLVIRDWTDTGNATNATVGGLTLAFGQVYTFEVRAIDYADNLSPTGSSDGITIFTFDTDGNGAVDAIDIEAFLTCSSGPNIPFPAGSPPDCARFDPDNDGDVDQSDFGVFQNCITGTDPVDLDCLN